MGLRGSRGSASPSRWRRLAAKGLMFYTTGGESSCPHTAGETVDTTGAGDAFIAGFMAEYAAGEDVEWCAAVALGRGIGGRRDGRT